MQDRIECGDKLWNWILRQMVNSACLKLLICLRNCFKPSSAV